MYIQLIFFVCIGTFNCWLFSGFYHVASVLTLKPNKHAILNLQKNNLFTRLKKHCIKEKTNSKGFFCLICSKYEHPQPRPPHTLDYDEFPVGLLLWRKSLQILLSCTLNLLLIGKKVLLFRIQWHQMVIFPLFFTYEQKFSN